MKLSRWRILFAAVLGIALTASKAQEGSLDQPSVAASTVVIVNTTAVPLNFAVRPEEGDWGDFQLDPGSQTTIVCDQCQTSSFEFSLRTEDSGVSYNLAPGRRYILAWNSEKNLWDIFNAK